MRKNHSCECPRAYEEGRAHPHPQRTMRLDKKQRRFMRIPFLVAGAIGAWRLQRWWFRQLADAQAAALLLDTADVASSMGVINIDAQRIRLGVLP